MTKELMKRYELLRDKYRNVFDTPDAVDAELVEIEKHLSDDCHFPGDPIDDGAELISAVRRDHE